MVGIEVNDTAIIKQSEALEAALSTDPKVEKKLRAIIRDYVLQARAEVVAGIQFQNGDPRNARQAVRTSVYKKVLGANISIYNTRKAHGSNDYAPPRTLKPGQRGGNRRTRSERTRQIQSYAPLDRGFILRFVNSGAKGRKISFKSDPKRENVVRGSRGGDLSKYGKTINTGSRGNIAPRNFFRPLGDKAMNKMRENLAKAIEEEMAAILENNLK